MVNPNLAESSHWQAAFEHYQWDRLDEAYAAVRNHGVGEGGTYIRYYRLIEAEHVTRQKSRVCQVTDWLTLEYVPQDIAGLEELLSTRALGACLEVGERFGWDHGVETRLALLAEETDAPWATFPYGYCASKEPYEKICLPNHLLDDEDEFRRAVSHEYAHVISINLSDANAPRWLEEAVSMLAEGSQDAQSHAEFVNGNSAWLSAPELERVLETRGHDEAEVESVLRAYHQCGWIGSYLASLAHERRIGDLLRAHTDERFGYNLMLRLLGRERSDGALRLVYRMSTAALFSRALAYAVSRFENGGGMGEATARL